jgi:hypothetical protein
MEERAAYITRLPEREADVLAVIVEGLTLLGYTVLRCQQWRADKSGSDAGLPDLWITSERWPEGAWCALEVKGTGGRLSASQQRLHAARRLYVVRSWEDAQTAIADFEQSLRERNP